MASAEKLLKQMRLNQRDVRFEDLVKVCTYYFGKPRIRGSHHYFLTPWKGEPLVNIQKARGKAKFYQVRQVLVAVDKLEGKDDV